MWDQLNLGDILVRYNFSACHMCSLDMLWLVDKEHLTSELSIISICVIVYRISKQSITSIVHILNSIYIIFYHFLYSELIKCSIMSFTF